MVLVTETEKMVYYAVREAAEGIIEVDQYGRTWEQVPTSHIILKDCAMNWKQVAGYLSALQRRGLYKRQNRDFGAVRATIVQVVEKMNQKDTDMTTADRILATMDMKTTCKDWEHHTDTCKKCHKGTHCSVGTELLDRAMDAHAHLEFCEDTLQTW